MIDYIKISTSRNNKNLQVLPFQSKIQRTKQTKMKAEKIDFPILY